MATPIATRMQQGIAAGMRLFGQGVYKATGKRFYLVTSEHYTANNKVYIVKDAGGHLECNCPATVACKHICFISRHINAERKEAQAAEIADALALLDRDSTGDEWEEDTRSEAEKQADAERRAEAMRAETQAEIERQAERESADRWSAYQDARMDEAVYMPTWKATGGKRWSDYPDVDAYN